MNNTPITISQELIDQLIKDEVQRQLESKVTDALTQENIQRSIRTFVNKKIERSISTNQVDIRKTGKGVRPVMNKNRFRNGILMQ